MREWAGCHLRHCDGGWWFRMLISCCPPLVIGRGVWWRVWQHLPNYVLIRQRLSIHQHTKHVIYSLFVFLMSSSYCSFGYNVRTGVKWYIYPQKGQADRNLVEASFWLEWNALAKSPDTCCWYWSVRVGCCWWWPWSLVVVGGGWGMLLVVGGSWLWLLVVVDDRRL